MAIWKPGASFGGRNAIAPALAVVAGSMLLIPSNYFGQAFSKSRDFTKTFGIVKPIDILEGRSSVTSIYWNKVLPYRFEVRPANSGAAAALAHEAAVFYKYYALGNVFAIDPLFRPKRILQVGLGSGEFPFVIKEVQTVEHVDMVELVPEVVEAYKKYSHPLIAQTVGHPKVSFHITDGRRFLQQAIAKGDKYDLIEIGITQLGSSGVSNMCRL